jgi:rhodanese-related sulfurtransferase
VETLAPEALASMLASGAPVVLFDVREEEEYQVSRLPGALRADPGAWTFRFVGQHGEAVKGKTVVFYCSVGVRSSKLAARVQGRLLEKGARAVYNLEGGVFRWHNDRRPLIDANGPTPLVHPYDRHWGGLIERQGETATQPSPVR